MTRVRLDHDGAAGRQGGGGVAAGHREGEREVARGVDGDRAGGHQQPTQLGLRRGGRGHGRVDDHLEVRALPTTAANSRS